MAVVAALGCVLLGAAACTGGSKHAASSGPPVSAVVVSGLPAGRAVTVRDDGTAAAPGQGVAFASHIYALGPSGGLPTTAHVTVRLEQPLPAGTPVVVATRETTAEPWSYLPATLTADGRSASFMTAHFSLFGILWIDLKKAAEVFKTDFLDELDGGATQTVKQPSCASQQQARADGYHISSSTTDTLYWCFGLDSAGHRVLQVVNHRRYPLQAQHPNMSVTSNDYDHGELAALSHLGSGKDVIIAPGGTVTFNADLSAGGTEGVSTQMDGFGQSLYALQTGVETLLELLTKFGAGSDSHTVDKVDTLLSVRSCADALGKGSGALLSGCFSARDILDAFGIKGLLLAPIMVFGPIFAFFHSEWNALIDQFNGHDTYQITIHRDQTAATAAHVC